MRYAQALILVLFMVFSGSVITCVGPHSDQAISIIPVPDSIIKKEKILAIIPEDLFSKPKHG